MKIALGVTGCIGAYKAAEILRLLQEGGAEVVVVMTENAQRFVGPLTFEALSGHEVVTDMFRPGSNVEIEHIALAQSIDLLLVAPATANMLGKFAYGIADDFLSTLYLATPAPCLIAPAMNVEMWRHPAVQANVRTLRERGVYFIEPEEGYLACRMVGPGRLAEPERIAAEALEIARRAKSLAHEHLLVTAGPTCEDIDPVRFISNRSSGRMGYAVAEEALKRGARLTLISGPTELAPPAGARLVRVRSAEEMLRAVLENLDNATVVVMAAAVADFRPAVARASKIKKSEGPPEIKLEPTPDILGELARPERRGARILVGFAAETEELVENARRKLREKNLDVIVANDIREGFGSDTNLVTILDRYGREERLPRLSKKEVARRLLDVVEEIRSRSPILAGPGS